MSKIIGRSCDVAISAAGSSYTELGEIMSASLSVSDDVADATTNDSGGFKEGMYADSQASLDVTMKYSKADAGQALLYTAKFAKTLYYFRVRPLASAAVEYEFIFQGLITDLTLDASTGDVEELSASIQSSGTITKQVQS